MKMKSWIAALLIVAVVLMIAGVTSPLWAQSSTLPPELEIRPTLCPCEVVLLEAPRGVHTVVAEFADNKPARTDLSGAGGTSNPTSTEWIFTPGINAAITVTRREVWEMSFVDSLNEINRGATNVVLFTMEIPLTASLTRIEINDDDKNVILIWP